MGPGIGAVLLCVVLTPLPVALRGQPSPASALDPEGEVDFDHMGMSGDADYYIDPKTRIPVEMRGHVKLLGNLATKLQRVVLN